MVKNFYNITLAENDGVECFVLRMQIFVRLLNLNIRGFIPRRDCHGTED